MGYNKIIMNGAQICDYLYIQNNAVSDDDFSYVDSEPAGWTDNTALLAKFDGDLNAGDSSILDKITGYQIRRREGTSGHTEYIGTVKDAEGKNKPDYIIDYTAKDKSDYTYYLYPSTTENNSGFEISHAPNVSKPINAEWGYWSLMIVDESEEDGLFYLNKLFKFEYNVEEDSMSNNANASVNQNFTSYPTVQLGTSNYWSGGLSALCGYISYNDVDFICNANMIEELKALSSEVRRKFLKDPDGNLWEVEITSPISITTNVNVLERIKTVKISWTQVGSAENISIINNPQKERVSWILTPDGNAQPYIDYIWDAQYKWDNSYRWTSNDDILQARNISNLGREIK